MLTHCCVFVSGVSAATLLHSKSLRGHRDCFEKCHLIANQKLSRSKVSRSAYEGMKLAVSQKLNRIIQYAQNKDSTSNGPGRRGTSLLCYSQQSDCKLLPQSDAQVPRYAPCWDKTKETVLPDYALRMMECHTAEELGLLQESQGGVWPSDGRKGRHVRSPQSVGGQTQSRQQGHSRDECEHFSSGGNVGLNHSCRKWRFYFHSLWKDERRFISLCSQPSLAFSLPSVWSLWPRLIWSCQTC